MPYTELYFKIQFYVFIIAMVVLGISLIYYSIKYLVDKFRKGE